MLPFSNRVVLCCILEFFTHISHRAEELAQIFGPVSFILQNSYSNILLTPKILLRSINTPPISSNPNTPTTPSATAAIIAAADKSTPISPQIVSPRLLSSSTTLLSPTTGSTAQSEVILRLIHGYSSTLEHSKEGTFFIYYY